MCDVCSNCIYGDLFIAIVCPISGSKQKRRNMASCSNISKKSGDARLITSEVKVEEPEIVIHFYRIFPNLNLSVIVEIISCINKSFCLNMSGEGSLCMVR